MTYPIDVRKRAASLVMEGRSCQEAEEAGKNASFLVFEDSLFNIDPYQINKQLPKEFYIRGELQSKQ